MGAGWHGGMGAGWFDLGAGWSGSGGAEMQRLFAMRADRPLAEVPVPSNFSAKFPVNGWDPDLIALTILPDFFKFKDKAGQTWDQAISVLPPPPVTQADIDSLLEDAITERPEAMGEILNQHQNQQLCFLQLLMLDRHSHPATFYLLKLAARIGEVVMMRLKVEHNRVRPSQICPTLYPPVAVPGHAAYPAGHALIAHLTARCLEDATTKTGQQTSPYSKALQELADRIGLNRVYAGLHFRSDISAGEDAGNQTHEFLSQMQFYKDVLKAAREEFK